MPQNSNAYFYEYAGESYFVADSLCTHMYSDAGSFN